MEKRIVFTLLIMLIGSFGMYAETPVCAEDEDATILIKICSGRVDGAGGPPSSFCTTDHEVVYADQQGIVTAQIAIAIANLDPNPVMGEKYQLPIGAPPIYVEYSDPDDNAIQVGPLTDFEFTGAYGGLSAQHPIFQKEFTITLDFDEFCKKQDAIAYSSLIKVTEANGNLYPIHSYSEPSNIFSCEVFEETCADCFGSTSCFSQNQEPVGTFLMCVLCEDVDGHGDPNPVGDYSYNPAPTNVDQSLVGDTPISVYPNPFSNFIELNYNNASPSSSVAIQILNADGKLIRQWQGNPERGPQQINLPTDDLSPGVYYIDIQTDQYRKSEKIIKLK